jgi:hypothetical protein
MNTALKMPSPHSDRDLQTVSVIKCEDAMVVVFGQCN